MGYSEAFRNRTKAQLLEQNRRLMREIAALNKEHDIQVESYHKVTAENNQLRKDLCAKEESNKKLADQFYAYREELVKWKSEAGDWHNKYDGIAHELKGVRGALNREAEMRVNAENKAKEMGHLADDLEKQRRELEHKREDVESLKASLADCCSAKIKEGRDLTSKIESLKEDLKKMTDSRDWYVKEAAKLRGWYDNLKKLYDKARKEGEEGCTMWREDAWKARDDRDFYKKKAENLEHATDDYRKKCVEIEKIQRKHNMLTLESLDNALKQWNYIDGKLSHDLCMPLESLIQLLDEYGVNDFCKLRERLMYGPTTAYSNALAQVRELEKENLDLKAIADDLEKQRRNLEKQRNELQDRVNILEQRWTDKFNQEDELLGRKISEWQEYDAVLVKYGVPSPKSLDAKLDPFDPDRQESVRAYNVMKNHKINSASGLDVELTSWGRIREVLHKHAIHYLNDLDNLLGIAVNTDLANGLGSKWRDVVDKYHVASPNELDKCLDQRQRMHHTLHAMKKDIEQFNQP